MVPMRERQLSMAMATTLALLTGAVGYTFVAPAEAPLRTSPVGLRGSFRRSESSTGTSFTSSEYVSVGAAVVVVASLITRQAEGGKYRPRAAQSKFGKVVGQWKAYQKIHYGALKGKQYDMRNFFFQEGYRGYGYASGRRFSLPGKGARMAKCRVWPGMELANFKTEDFISAKPSSLDGAKEVGSYMTKPDEFKELQSPAQVPEFKPLPRGYMLQMDVAEERRPEEQEEYDAYNESRCNLFAAAKQVAGASLDKNIITDQAVLTDLFEWVKGDLSDLLMQKGQHDQSVDIAKITKSPDGKSLVFDSLLKRSDLTTNRKTRMKGGHWQEGHPTSPIHVGSYFPAALRWASGERDSTFDMARKSPGLTWQRRVNPSFDDMAKVVMASSKVDMSHTVATVPDDSNVCLKFVEFASGGLSFLIRAPKTLMNESEVLQLKEHDWESKDRVNAMLTYQELAVGGQDGMVLLLHKRNRDFRTCFIKEVLTKKTEDFKKNSPQVVAAAELRFGRVTEMLTKVKEQLANADDGPWVLQWRKGEILLGKYQQVETPKEYFKPRWKPYGGKEPIDWSRWVPEMFR